MNLYLSQIAGWLENTTGAPQQIIHTKERGDIRYTDHDSQSDAMGMTIIADADIDIRSISWSGEHGLGLNTDAASSENGEKVHVILWSDSEISKDDRGYYMDVEGALNGELVLYNPKTEVTGEVIKQMLGVKAPEIGKSEPDAPPIEADDAKLTTFGSKIQSLMDEVYGAWQKEENKGKGKWDVLDGFPEAHQIAVLFGNFNYQVENGGLDQWIYNGYFHEDAEKLAEYLEAGAELDERCRTILDKVYRLDQYARETDCDRDGSYRDPDDEDGECGFIGDMIDSGAFDTWYYDKCGKDDWWQTVCGIIEKVTGHELSPVIQDERGDGNAATSRPLQVYIENVHDESIGGFTIPLPTTTEAIQPFLNSAEIAGRQDAAMLEVKSDIEGLGRALTETIRKSMSPNTLDELNYLAARIGALSDDGRETFLAVVEAGKHCGSVQELINLSSPANLECFCLQPAFTAGQYGDFLLDMRKDETAEVFRKLENSANPDEKAFAQYVLRLEAFIDHDAFGRGVAKEEDGAFTKRGYITESESGFKEIYRGAKDIPDEYRIFTKPDEIVRPLMKLFDVDLPSTLLKIHAVCCVSTSSAPENLKTLLSGREDIDRLLMVNEQRVYLAPATDVYGSGSIAAKTIEHWARTPGTSFYAIRIDNEAGEANKGHIIELNTDALLSSIKRHSVSPDRFDAVRHDGFSRSYDPASWEKAADSQQRDIKSVTTHYPANALETAAIRFSSLVDASEAIGETLDAATFFPAVGAAFLTAAENPQPDMLRVNNEAAKELLARGDADVYRLTPGGAEKLAPIEAARAVSFAKNHEVAIRREDAPGLDKWAKRTADKLIQQAERGERDKSKHKGEEL